MRPFLLGVTTALLGLGLVASAFAQEREVGVAVRVAVSLSRLSFEELPPRDPGDLRNQTRSGWVTGVDVLIPATGKVTTHIGLEITQRGGQLAFQDLAQRTEERIRLIYVNVPVSWMVAIPHSGSRFYLGGGGYLSVKMSATQETVNTSFRAPIETEELGSAIEPIDYGLLFGVGLSFKRYGIAEARLALGLAAINSEASREDYGRISNRVLQIGVGIRF